MSNGSDTRPWITIFPDHPGAFAWLLPPCSEMESTSYVGPCYGDLYPNESRAVRTVFHGYLGEKELEELLAKCDIGVVPMSSDSFVGVPNKFAASGSKLGFQN